MLQQPKGSLQEVLWLGASGTNLLGFCFMFLSNNNNIKKKEESKHFGVNKDKSMAFYPSSNPAVGAQEGVSRQLGPAACSWQQDNAAERSE